MNEFYNTPVIQLYIDVETTLCVHPALKCLTELFCQSSFHFVYVSVAHMLRGYNGYKNVNFMENAKHSEKTIQNIYQKLAALEHQLTDYRYVSSHYVIKN